MKPFKSLKKFKVLVAAPQNEVKNYCSDEYLSRITNLTYKNYDILIVDNSETNDNAKKLRKLGIKCLHVKPKQKENQKYIAESQELIRLEALRGGYDFVMMIETDVIVPHDIIERLLAHQKQVVSGTYFIGEGSDSRLMLQDIEKTGKHFRHTVNIDGGYGILKVDGKLNQVLHAGLGNTLIHKSVLEQIKFRWIEGVDSHSDTFFAVDLDMLGIPVFVDTSLHSKHLNTSWLEQDLMNSLKK